MSRKTPLLVARDPADWTNAFPQRHFATRHALSEHRLLQLDRLIELARSMPGDRIEYNGNQAQHGVAPEKQPVVDLAPAEIVERIETAGAWMVLKRVESDPAYKALLDEVLGGVARQRGYQSLHEAGFDDIEGYIFISSARSTTPFHFDAEENLFVQIKGHKFFHIFDNDDRALVSDEDLEINPARHRNIAYKEEFEERAVVYEMDAGDGMFTPHLWPHWVRTGDSYSISMAITWKSAPVIRMNKLLAANGLMRNLGLPQAAPGRRPAWDAAKVALYSASRAVIEPLRRSEGMRRMLRGLVFGQKANYFYKTRQT